MRRKFKGPTLALLSTLLLTCSEDQVATRSYPVVETAAVTDINEQGAMLNAEILDAGLSGISDHGFLYSEISYVAIDISERISLGSKPAAGPFSALANRGLVRGEQYYVKPYAISGSGKTVVYGQMVSFVSEGSSVPEISNFTPRHGVIGDTVIVTGSGFSSVRFNNTVLFGDVGIGVLKSSTDSIWCRVPTHLALDAHSVRVKVGQLEATTEGKFTLDALTLTSYAPNAVSFGDTVTIKGTNFPRQKEFVLIHVLGQPTVILSSTSNEISAVVSANVVVPEGQVHLAAGLQAATAPEKITLLKPEIQGITPASGTNGTELTLAGDHFSPVVANNKVVIDGKTLQVVSATRTAVKVKLPGGIKPGTYPISITIAGQTTVSGSTFEIITPQITSISPLNGTWGNTITITGSHFGATTTDNKVKFGTINAEVTHASPTELKVTVPAGLLTKSSQISLQVTSVDNLTATAATSFTLDAPEIFSFTPDEGKSKTLVTISGKNFNPVSSNHTVSFGGKVADVVSASASQLVVKLPPSLADTSVRIDLALAEYTASTTQLFHLVSPWKKVANLMGSRRSNATAFALGGYGYIGAGYETQAGLGATIKTVWKYDPAGDSWTQVTGFRFPNEGTTSSFTDMIAITDGTNAFVGLGATSSPESRIRRYDPPTDTWTDAATIGGNTTNALDNSVAYSINGRGYVATGRDRLNRATTKMWAYDPASNAWAAKTDLPGQARWDAAGFSIGNKAYLVGGATCGKCASTVEDSWEYDVAANTWKRLRNFPGAKRISSTGFSVNGKGYLVGGVTYHDIQGAVRISDFWQYDPVTDVWTQHEDFPGGKRAEAVAFVIGNKAYFGTGLSENAYMKDLWEFDPSKL